MNWGLVVTPGTYNWSLPETLTFDAQVGDYIYVAAWSDDAVAQGWIGEFKTTSYNILTNSSDWEFFLINENLDDGAPAPEVDYLGTQILSAQWSTVSNFVEYGEGPWGNVAVNSNADWIWGTQLLQGVW